MLASKLGKIHSLPENAYHMSETNAHTKLDDFIPRSHTSEELAALRAMSPDDRAAFLRLTRQYRLLFEQQLRTLSSQGGTPPDPAAQQ